MTDQDEQNLLDAPHYKKLIPIVNRVLFRSLPYPEPARLIAAGETPIAFMPLPAKHDAGCCDGPARSRTDRSLDGLPRRLLVGEQALRDRAHSPRPAANLRAQRRA